jgi:hypothetical protein
MIAVEKYTPSKKSVELGRQRLNTRQGHAKKLIFKIIQF